MERLQEQLREFIGRMEDHAAFASSLDELLSVYPFNEFEYIVSTLLAGQKVSLDEYLELRRSYVERNLYLHLFEEGPRGFGEVWAHAHLRELAPSLRIAGKQFDPGFDGEYDLFCEPRIRIEVKASRAVEFNRDAPLYVKALASNSTKPFDMNFQQIKPACCDVFVWVAAWRDVIKYWVIPSHDVEASRYYRQTQHRGNAGEGQLHLNQSNIHDFDLYLVQPKDIEAAVARAYEDQSRSRGRQ